MRWVWGLIVLVGICLVMGAAAAAIFEGYASDAEMRPGNSAPALLLGLAGTVTVLVGICGQALRIRAAREKG